MIIASIQTRPIIAQNDTDLCMLLHIENQFAENIKSYAKGKLVSACTFISYII